HHAKGRMSVDNVQRTSPINAYIGLGSNLGDRGAHLAAAIDLLEKTENTRVISVSTFLENAAVGGPENSPVFLNAAARLETTLGSHALLRRLMEIERELGRQRRDKWEPRIIDLDLLLY